MADTTIKVDSAVRDRLALLADEQGMTLRDFVAHLATASATHEELRDRRTAAEAYVIEHLKPDFNAEDAAAGEQIWQDLAAKAAGGIPSNPRAS